MLHKVVKRIVNLYPHVSKAAPEKIRLEVLGTVSRFHQSTFVFRMLLELEVALTKALPNGIFMLRSMIMTSPLSSSSPRCVSRSQASPSLGGGHGLSLSVRDLLSWAGFITSSLTPPTRPASISSIAHGLEPWEAYVHGAALVLLDGLGLGAGMSPTAVTRLRMACAKVLSKQVSVHMYCSSFAVRASTRYTKKKTYS